MTTTAPEVADPAIGTLHLDVREIPVLAMGADEDGETWIRTPSGTFLFTGTRLISISSGDGDGTIRRMEYDRDSRGMSPWNP